MNSIYTLYSFKKKNFETKKIIPDKNIKTKDEIGRDTNQNVILREMGNDCAQIPLKLLAYWFVNPNKYKNLHF